MVLRFSRYGCNHKFIDAYVIIVDGAEFQLYDASTSLPLNDTTIASYLTLTNLTLDQEGSYKCKGMNNVTNLIGATEEISIYLTVHCMCSVLKRHSSKSFSYLQLLLEYSDVIHHLIILYLLMDRLLFPSMSVLPLHQLEMN